MKLKGFDFSKWIKRVAFPVGLSMFFVTLVAVLEKELPLFDFENWKFVAHAHLLTTGLVKNLSLFFLCIAMPQVGKSRKSSSEKCLFPKRNIVSSLEGIFLIQSSTDPNPAEN